MFQPVYYEFKMTISDNKTVRLPIQIFMVLLSIFNTTWLGASGMWRDNYESLTEIGAGTLKVFVWEVYDLRLLSETNSFSWQNRFVLEFNYKRNLKKQEVIKASMEEMRRQKSITIANLAKWEKYLEQGIAPVQKGTKAAIEWMPDRRIAFHYEFKAPVIIEDELFARAFIRIWLGPETSEPELRAALLGED